MTWWMKYQIFAPIFLLKLLNLFWYFFMWRILIRYITSWDFVSSYANVTFLRALRESEATDDRSDDEDDGDDEVDEKED